MRKSLARFLETTVGFTLIELLIAVAIIVILSGVGIAGFNSANKISYLKQNAQDIKTLARKLRTDAGAAYKPSGSCTTVPGSVYGTFISFRQNSNTITYGTLCFDPPGATSSSNDYSVYSTKQLPTGLKVGYGVGTPVNTTTFFGFDGIVRFFSYGVGKLYPNHDELNNIAAVVGEITSATPVLSITLTDGTDITTGNRYYIHFNQNGLVCEQRYPTVTCAQ